MAQNEITKKAPKLTSFFNIKKANRLTDSLLYISYHEDTLDFQWEKLIIRTKMILLVCEFQILRKSHRSNAEPSTSSYDMQAIRFENVSADHAMYCDEILMKMT